MAKSAIDLIMEFEGCRLNAYPDPIAGWRVPTIGYGTTIYPNGRTVKSGDKISEGQATYYLKHYVDKLIVPILSVSIPAWLEMNENQHAALISFGYNLGANFFRKPNFESITRLCESISRWDDKDWVLEQFIKYCNPHDPAVTEGLKRRRKAEAELFCKPVLSD